MRASALGCALLMLNGCGGSSASKPVAQVALQIERLKSSDRIHRFAAAELLGNMGSEAGGGVDALIETVNRDADGEVRIAAAAAIMKIRPDAEVPVSVIAESLRHNDRRVRNTAVAALERMREGAREEVVERLTPDAASEEPRVRGAARRAIWEVDQSVARPMLIEALERDDEIEVRIATECLKEGTDVAVAGLIDALSTGNDRVRERAAMILAQIGPNAAEAVPILIGSLEDDEENVRKWSAIALGLIGVRTEGVREVLEGASADTSAAVREAVEQALGRLEF